MALKNGLRVLGEAVGDLEATVASFDGVNEEVPYARGVVDGDLCSVYIYLFLVMARESRNEDRALSLHRTSYASITRYQRPYPT